MTTSVTQSRTTGIPPAAPLSASAIDGRIRGIVDRLDASAATTIGYPVARDIDYRPTAPLLKHLLNNVGEPRVDPLFPGHVRDLEREVLGFAAQLFRAPPGFSGYITDGGTEGNLYGLWLARTKLPDAVAYFSRAAHYSVPKACRLLGVPAVQVAATSAGQINSAEQGRRAGRHRGRPASSWPTSAPP